MNCSVFVSRICLNIWLDKFEYLSGLNTTRLASFPSKNLNNTVNNSFFPRLSTWVTAKSNISTKIGFLLFTSVSCLRAVMTYEDNIKELTADVFCIIETCNKERCEFANGHRYSPSPIYACEKCKAWKFVQKFPFSEQEQFPTNHSDLHQKRLKFDQIWNKRIRSLLADDFSNLFFFLYHFSHFHSNVNQSNSINLQSTYRKS